MKKAVALFITVLYLAVSSGVVLQIHHCMGEVADFGVLASKEEVCGSCGMGKDSNSCCKDELKIVKLQDSHKLLNGNYQLESPQSLIANQYSPVAYRTLRQVLTVTGSHAPPGLLSPPLYIVNCVFRI